MAKLVISCFYDYFARKTDKYYVSEIDFHNNPPFDLIQEIGRLFSMDYMNVKGLVQFALIWQEQVEAVEKDLLSVLLLRSSQSILQPILKSHLNCKVLKLSTRLLIVQSFSLSKEFGAGPKTTFQKCGMKVEH